MQHPIITSPLLVLLLAVIVVSGHVPVPARRTGAGHHPFGGHHHQPQQQQQQAQQPQQQHPQQPQPQQQQPHPQQPQSQQQQAQQPQQQHPQQPQQPQQHPQQPQPQQQEGAKQLPPQQKEGDTNTNPARMFGWDPERAKQSCGGNSYCLMKQEFLNAHNWVRQYNFKLPALTWDDNLARSAGQYAQNRAKDCRTIHSDMPYGENIFWGKKLHWMASDAVYFWYIEKQWYDFVKVTCNAPPNSVGCGHFTQIVWKDSVRLGCAIQTCTDQSLGMLVICEYDPPGNYDNENPLDDNNAKHA